MAGSCNRHLRFLCEEIFGFLLSILLIVFYPLLLSIQFLRKVLFLILCKTNCSSRLCPDVSFKAFFGNPGIVRLQGHFLLLFFTTVFIGLQNYYFTCPSKLPVPTSSLFVVQNIQRYEATPWNLTIFTDQAARWNSQFPDIRYHVLCGVVDQHIIGCSVFDWHCTHFHWKPTKSGWQQYRITYWDRRILNIPYPDIISTLNFLDVIRYRAHAKNSNIIKILNYSFP